LFEPGVPERELWMVNGWRCLRGTPFMVHTKAARAVFQDVSARKRRLAVARHSNVEIVGNGDGRSNLDIGMSSYIGLTVHRRQVASGYFFSGKNFGAGASACGFSVAAGASADFDPSVCSMASSSEAGCRSQAQNARGMRQDKNRAYHFIEGHQG
jgi:hypothetical protein